MEKIMSQPMWVHTRPRAHRCDRHSIVWKRLISAPLFAQVLYYHHSSLSIYPILCVPSHLQYHFMATFTHFNNFLL